MCRILSRRAARLTVGVIVAGTLLLLSVSLVGTDARAAGFGAVALATPALIMIDVAERRLPNGIVGSLLGVVVGCVVLHALPAAPLELVAATVAGTVTFIAYGVLALGGGLGMGDVKLAGALAVLLGSISTQAAIAAAVLPFVFAAPLALFLVWSRKTPNESIVFGPWLLAGFWASTVVFARPC